MTREDEFLGVIKSAQERARIAQLARLSFSDWWSVFKEETVRPIFQDAVSALRKADYETASQLDLNGKGILLQAGNPSVNLSLLANSDSIQVQSTAPFVVPELWTDRNAISEKKIKELVTKFLEGLADLSTPVRQRNT